MKAINIVALVVVIGSITSGSLLGFFIQDVQPKGQRYSFSAFATETSTGVKCGTIPKNYTDWLGIEVIGNRTAMSFSVVTVFDVGQNIRVDLPLNQTANVYYKPVNETYELIIVPLASYFGPGDLVSIVIAYSISTFPGQTATLTGIPIIQQNLSC